MSLQLLLSYQLGLLLNGFDLSLQHSLHNFTQMLGAIGNQVKWMNVQPSGLAAVPPTPPLRSGLISQAPAAPLAPPPPPPPNVSSCSGLPVPSPLPPLPPPLPPPLLTCSFSPLCKGASACRPQWPAINNATRAAAPSGAANTNLEALRILGMLVAPALCPTLRWVE